MKTAVYGGSFDPPHLGHLTAARDVYEAISPDRVLLVPAFSPPHKEQAEDSASPEQRLEMTGLLADELEWAEVSALELERGGNSYTVETLESLKEQNPEDELFLMLGTDMFLSFESWYRFERIFELAELVVFSRLLGEEAQLEPYIEHLKETYGARITLVRHRPFEISSSRLRTIFKMRGGSAFLPDSIYSYIIKHRLYGARPEIFWLREKSYAHLNPKRVEHVRSTELEAVRLATRWGCDQEDAAEAAILHDITKKLNMEEQLLLCEKYGIIADGIEMTEVKLFHAKTGAALSRDLFGINDAVYDAILWHTTGKPDMSLLEKIIYLADYIEPCRTFEGVNEMRRLAYSDIDAALEMGLKLSLDDLKARGKVPHPRSQGAFDYLHSGKEE